MISCKQRTLRYTMSLQPINPKPYLCSLIGQRVIVRLKFSGTEYHGTLLSIDNYMNILFDKDVIEIESPTAGKQPSLEKGITLGNELFVRCNNVLWIGKAQQDEI